MPSHRAGWLIGVHAAMRARQRGMSRADDLALVSEYGTEVESGYLLRERDVDDYEHECKRRIARMRRLVGVRVVSDGGRLITAYRTTAHRQRRLLGRP